MHRSWLELVDSEGPFLAIPPLKRVWPNGIPDFRAIHSDRFTALVDAKKDFEQAWERVDQNPDDDKALSNYRAVRDEWVQTVLREVIGWQESLRWAETSGIKAQSPNRNVAIAPQGVLVDLEGNNVALVYVIDPVDSLRETPSDGWAATPIDRMEELLRTADVPIGIVTDGRWWGLVSYKSGNMPASGVVDSITWIEEPRTRDAFLTLLGRQYLIGGDPKERLPLLFEESIAAAEEITEALGVQVRSAVELLVQSFSESALEAESRGQSDPLPERSRDVYEAAVTIMMRTVFLLFAEERGMLPAGELFEQSYGLVGRLEQLSRREAEEGEESLDATSMTWHRLLAASAAIYSGATFENLRMPAYGGSLFDPARFRWLTSATEVGTLAIAVSDRVMLHVLRSVQLAQLKAGEARQISFRDIDVEQIGYIYEGLLGYTATRVNESYVGLRGAAGAEPEMPLDRLEKLRHENPDPKKFAAALQEWVSNDQPAAKAQTSSAIAKGLNANLDPSLMSALSQAVGGNSELRDRIKPFLGIMRQDLRSHPFVVLPGGLLLKETPSRKNAGAHYTPKSLAEEVVLHALQPLCYSPGPHQTGDETEWKLRPSEEILDLKVADIACGSGAFLVAAARYLADRVVEAWIAEDPENVHRKDLHLRAIRQVVANCLYGADINEMAVEMAKLSLWLVSLDRDLPFSFVDDKIFLGNSLLGLTSLDQLRALHIDPANASGQDVLSDVDIDLEAVMRKAIEVRERLASEIDEDDPMRSATAKKRQYLQLQAATKELRTVADGVIAAGLPLGGKPGTALDDAFQNLRLAIKKAQLTNVDGEADSSWLDSMIEIGLSPSVETDYMRWEPLHWVLEAPDVMIDHGGFDAIVGNPPFLGGQKLTGSMGIDVRDWLLNIIAGGRRGSADLVAYFFLRAMRLLTGHGTLGLIATNTIAQGDTREVGLDAMVEDGFTITRAIQSRSWPAASANLEYAAVWGTRASIPSSVKRVVSESEVAKISTLLEANGRVEGLPIVLMENKRMAFIGSYVLGDGFVIDQDQAEAWIAADSRNSEVLFPFLNGKDLNSRPDASPSRWIIDFNDMNIEIAESYEHAFSQVARDVRPERQRRKPNGDYELRRPRSEKWWQFAERSPGMRAAIADLEKVLVIGLTSTTVMPMRVSTGKVFSHALGVFATDDFGTQALLSSSMHQIWAITYGSTLGKGIRYTHSDVFETFPRPTNIARLREVGQCLDEVRREIMIRREIGLTNLYNRINDPSISGDADVDLLRQIHVELDTIVLESYAWSDVLPEHGFHEFRGVVRWTISPKARVEVLDRLLEENHRRAALEVASGAKAKKSGKRKSSVEQGEALF
jgi:hypothetical protein